VEMMNAWFHFLLSESEFSFAYNFGINSINITNKSEIEVHLEAVFAQLI